MAIQDILPKSRLTLRYKTDIQGVPEDIELPFRIMVTGDFSGKLSHKLPLDERKAISFKGASVDGVIKGMRIKVPVTDSEGETHNIPIEDIQSFQPEAICKSVKKLDDLLAAKEMLSYLLTSLNNSTKFRMALKGLIDDPNAAEALKKMLAPTYENATKLPPRLLEAES
jgi:type VI secretion system protein ImpB